MRARALQARLKTTRAIADYGDYIGIGSPLCHNLLAVDKASLKITYALDTWHQGRAALENGSEAKDELLELWDRLTALIESGEFQQYLEGRDEIANPLPVFTVADGKLIESETDAYGWPHPDAEGRMQYDNTHFPTRAQAIEHGLKEARASISIIGSAVEHKRRELAELKQELAAEHQTVAMLETLQAQEAMT